MSEEGDRPTLMQAVKERSTEPCVDAVAPTGCSKEVPEHGNAFSEQRIGTLWKNQENIDDEAMSSLFNNDKRTAKMVKLTAFYGRG